MVAKLCPCQHRWNSACCSTIQIALHVQGCLGSSATRSDGLTVDRVSDVASSEYSSGRCRRASTSRQNHVASGIQVHMTLEERRLGVVADGNEGCRNIKPLRRCRGALFSLELEVREPLFLTAKSLDLCVPEHCDGAMVQDLLRQNATGPKQRATVDHSDLSTGSRQIEGIFHRMVSTADDSHVMIAVKEPIASRAATHSSAPKSVFTFHLKPTRFCSASKNHGLCSQGRVGSVEEDGQRRSCEVHRDHRGADEPSSETA
mmetsp:Transcript_56472/g.123455  ORF Transcript_56472/g.123455 Transcript_56472/m.123455 type:complete len:260 (-) Transcript_56472:942-1721(-)